MVFAREGASPRAEWSSRHRHAAGADGARGGRDDAEHHLRKGSARHVSARLEEEVLSAAHASSRNGDGQLSPDAGRRRLLHVVHEPTAGSSPTTATTIRATPATSSRRWRRRRTASRRSSSCSPSDWPRSIPSQQAARDRSLARAACAGWTTSSLPRVEDVVRLTPTIVEVIVKAPAAARHFHPGQFYRLQNYESLAPRGVTATMPLLMEGIALTGAWVDKEKGLLSLIALELGVSSRLVAYLREGRAGGGDGPDRRADRDPRGPERAAARRRPRQRRAVLDRQGDARDAATR